MEAPEGDGSCTACSLTLVHPSWDFCFYLWTNEQPGFVWEQAGGEATAKPYLNTNPGLSLFPWLPCVGLLSRSISVPTGGHLWELLHPYWVSLPSAQPG